MSGDGLIELIRREATIIAAMRQWTGTVVATSYDPTKHAIKGVLVPHEVETGWIPIGVGAIGSGSGDLMGPKVGSADALDGDQFNVQFDAGDPNTLIATHRIFSDTDVPPQVQAGEMMRRHALSQQLYFNAAGDAILSRDDGSMVKLKASGDTVHMPATGKMAYHGGDPDDGGSFDFVVTESGPSTNVKAKFG